jgi:hypothetical protein
MENARMAIPIVTHASNDTHQPPNPLTAIEHECAARGLEPKVVDGTLAIFHHGEPVAGLHIDHPAESPHAVVKLTLAGVKGPDRKYTGGTRSTNAIVRTILAHVTERQLKTTRDLALTERRNALQEELTNTFAEFGVTDEDYRDGPLSVVTSEDASGIDVLLDVQRATPDQFRALLLALVKRGLQPASQRTEAAKRSAPTTVSHDRVAHLLATLPQDES